MHNTMLEILFCDITALRILRLHSHCRVRTRKKLIELTSVESLSLICRTHLRNVCNYSQHWLQPHFWLLLCFRFEHFERFLHDIWGPLLCNHIFDCWFRFQACMQQYVRQHLFSQTDSDQGIAFWKDVSGSCKNVFQHQ